MDQDRVLDSGVQSLSPQLEIRRQGFFQPGTCNIIQIVHVLGNYPGSEYGFKKGNMTGEQSVLCTPE